MVVDSSELQLDIESHQSMIIRDAATEEIVGLVIRNFVANTGILEWASDIVYHST